MMSAVAPASVDPDCPPIVVDYALQAVEYVRRSLAMDLDFDDGTLPILDHYLHQIADPKPAAAALVAATAGAYFGEVVRRRMGGAWRAGGDAATWRLVLPSGLSFSPIGFALTAILRRDDDDPAFEGPAKVMAIVEATLERMSPVSEDDYYSLCGRLDTLEHVEDVLLAARTVAPS
jgi:hypothetical protein